MRHKAICAATVFLQNEVGEIFLIERVNTGWRDGFYDGLSGHIEKGERAADAAVRESSEEGGVKIKKQDLKLAHVISLKRDSEDEDAHYFYFVASNWEGKPENNEDGERGKVIWINKDSIEKYPIVPTIKQALTNIWNNVTYSEFVY